ncbi:MAG: hypothetical protein WD969_00125 [Paracoccaceae bacterium]
MTEFHKLAMALALIGALGACAAEPTGEAQLDNPSPDVPDVALGMVGDRFIDFFSERCVASERANRAPDTSGLIPAPPAVAARYPKVPDYAELSGRSLAFWVAPEDPDGAVVLVVEEIAGSERCAAVTGAFTMSSFADTLRIGYPDYAGERTDETIVNARIFLDEADVDRRSRVYSTYHDEQHGVSALVLSLSDATN